MFPVHLIAGIWGTLLRTTVVTVVTVVAAAGQAAVGDLALVQLGQDLILGGLGFSLPVAAGHPRPI